MTLRREIPLLLLAGALFAACFFLPVERLAPPGPTAASLHLLRDYARHHLPLGLAPALLIGGAIVAFLRRPALLRYLGPAAPKPLAYATASIGGAVLSVCSCGALPLFAAIRRAGAGLGPACSFLYAAPAINVLAFILTARVLGLPLAAARAAGAIACSLLVGLAMAALFRRDPAHQTPAPDAFDSPAPPPPSLSWPKTLAVLTASLAALLFLNLSPSGFTGLLRCCDGGTTATPFQALAIDRDGDTAAIQAPSGQTTTVPASRLADVQPVHATPLAAACYHYRFALAGLAAACLLVMLLAWSSRAALADWLAASWALAKSILPFLVLGIAASGFLLGSPGRPGAIPPHAIASALQGNSLASNLAAATAAAFMYFATLTEVPIVQGLLHSGMGPGPALAMLLAGPSVSLPSLLVLLSLLGPRKTLSFLLLVILLSTLSGLLYGAL